MRGRFGLDGPSVWTSDRKASADEEVDGEGWDHDGTIPWSASASSQDVEAEWSAALDGHRGVADESMSMGSQAEDSWETSWPWQSSPSALRLRLRDWIGRDSWARSSMERGAREEEVIGKKKGGGYLGRRGTHGGRPLDIHTLPFACCSCPQITDAVRIFSYSSRLVLSPPSPHGSAWLRAAHNRQPSPSDAVMRISPHPLLISTYPARTCPS